MTSTIQRQAATDSDQRVAQAGARARAAAAPLALLPRAAKDAALRALGDALLGATDRIVAANEADLARGTAADTPDGLLDRLRLTPERVTAIATALRELAALPDPVGDVVRGSTLANGLQLRQVRVPMGVVGMVYEARPNVTVDAAGLGLKSGNAMILRGGSAAADTNRVIVQVLRESLRDSGIPADAVQLLEGGHEDVDALITARGLVDLVIPRGSDRLIQAVVQGATVPVIETGVGNCHVYLDAAADPDQAVAIVLNSKTDRPSVCNAAESVVVHRDIAPTVLPRLYDALVEAGVELRTDERASEIAERAGAPYRTATQEDFGTEYLDLKLSVAVVDDLDAAIAHIGRHGSGHTEVIVTTDRSAARRFVAEIDAAVVTVNASSRFTDGGEFGFGAEIGISTQKLHARGPMGLAELTSTKWVVEGDGQIR